MASKPRVCIDFDNTIWDGSAIFPGCIEKLRKFQEHFVVCIHSARATEAERQQMIGLLVLHGVPYDEIIAKPDAVAYIDDKGWKFESWDKINF